MKKFKINDEVIYEEHLCKITYIFKDKTNILNYNTGSQMYVNSGALEILNKKDKIKKNHI